ncbi:hypothetical protein RSOLAG22IIIB_09183 [Rhizoctonia solani]|uniref:C2H2-type domain-containing protein n=1 Tax=Rhizoctonia solani TaxID=456999 RepID=A0A0K6FXD2_9AGAM|nr:hypothetical protein RSOLAG22IIIB_09183 [Rhizoctonia solani]
MPDHESQGPYFQSFEGLGSVAENPFHVQAAGIPLVPTFGETGSPTMAHYGFQYPSTYNAIYSPILPSETPVHAQSTNTIVSPVTQPAVVPTSQFPPAHPEPVSFVHRAPIDPGHSNDTGPNVPTTEVRMDVRLVINPTKAAIEDYVREFKKTLSRHVKKVTCSMCLLEATRRTTQHSTKPTNLERHLFSHFGVKPFMCTGCSKSFTTKDQKVRHRCDCAGNLKA